MSARDVAGWSDSNQQEIIGIVEQLALDASDGDTSIPQSRLVEILEAVSFCIDEGEKALAGQCVSEAGSSKLCSTSELAASELYKRGYASLVSKAKQALSAYNALAAVFDDYGMEEYGIAFRKEIPEALASFDPRYRPAEYNIFSYPSPPDDGSVGIDAIAEEIRLIGEEQRLLSRLDRAVVCGIAAEASACGENLYETVLKKTRG